MAPLGHPRHRDPARRLVSLVAALALVVGCGPSQTIVSASIPGPSQASGAPSTTQGPTETTETTSPPEAPTAEQLIEADLASGAIDEPTSLLYRIEAMFGAPELPAKYAAGTQEEEFRGAEHGQAGIRSVPGRRPAAGQAVHRPSDRSGKRVLAERGRGLAGSRPRTA